MLLLAVNKHVFIYARMHNSTISPPAEVPRQIDCFQELLKHLSTLNNITVDSVSVFSHLQHDYKNTLLFNINTEIVCVYFVNVVSILCYYQHQVHEKI